MIESRNLLLADYRRATHVPQLRQRPFVDYLRENVDYLIASSLCYGPYFSAPQLYPREYAEYRTIFDQSQELARFTPSNMNPGADLIIFKVRR